LPHDEDAARGRLGGARAVVHASAELHVGGIVKELQRRRFRAEYASMPFRITWHGVVERLVGDDAH
jgi:hypothetical protein